MAKVLKLQITKKKGEPPVQADFLHLIEGVGIEGDWHAGRLDRAVCLCRKELRDWMEEQSVEGLCFSKQKENLLIEGFGASLRPGMLLRGREAVLEISDVPKHCFPETCARSQAGLSCQLRGEYQMARILRSGVLAVGEEIVLC